ncbi:hypothetical protein MNBD_GAMMA18-816 [hydrothermal vent metagenome]|uniref:SPOR domain-containing protein n=1 Tax=hydrothermal vent metagenome TaxID=652676 RepID=A0A3B0ZDR3_9ZZZZ
MNNVKTSRMHELFIDDVEYQSIRFAWEYFSSVLLLQGDEGTVGSVIQHLNCDMGSHHKIARTDSTFPADEASFVAFLADSWGLSQGRCADDGLAAFVECIEKNQRIGARYLLQVDNADTLADEHWRLLRTLCQLGGGLFGVMLAGRQLEERCEKFLTPFGVSCLYHHLGNNVSASPAANAKEVIEPPDANSSANKGRPWYRSFYVLMIVIVLLILLFFQQKINQWMVTPQLAVVESESQPTASQVDGGVVVPDGIKRELPLKKIVTNNVVILNLTDDVNEISVESKATDEEIEDILVADVAVEPTPVVDEPKPVPAAFPKEGSKLKTENWILSQPSQGYTFHVMSVRSEQRLRELIIDEGLEDKAAYYKAKRKSGTWFVLLIGDYPDENKAKKDISTLEKQLGVEGILLRKFEYSQKDIAASRS